MKEILASGEADNCQGSAEVEAPLQHCQFDDHENYDDGDNEEEEKEDDSLSR